MFSKQTKTSQSATSSSSNALAVSDPSKLRARVASLVGEGITIEGGLVGEGDLQIDGIIRGDVRVTSLTVGETGHIEGSIVAETVELRGRVIGSITAKQVRLYGTAYVDGDVTHEQLTVETGAFFQGRSLKFQRAATPASQPAANSTATDGEILPPAVS